MDLRAGSLTILCAAIDFGVSFSAAETCRARCTWDELGSGHGSHTAGESPVVQAGKHL